MFSVGEDVEADALFKRGWTVSAIARHLGRDRKTVRSYLSGERTPGVRRPANPDPLDEHRAYVAARFVDDPHLWASALFDEVIALGYRSSYVSFAPQVRLAGLRPHCEACSGVKGRETIEIDHPPGEEALCGIPHRASYGAPGTMRPAPDLVCIGAGRSREGADPRRIIPRPTSAHKLSLSMIERGRQCHWNGKVRWLRGPPGSLRR